MSHINVSHKDVYNIDVYHKDVYHTNAYHNDMTDIQHSNQLLRFMSANEYECRVRAEGEETPSIRGIGTEEKDAPK